MSQFQTKVLANVGAASPSTAGNAGFTGKYYPFTYFVTGTPAAVSAVPIGVAPCKGHLVGVSFDLTAGQAGTTNVAFNVGVAPQGTGTSATVLDTAGTLGTPVVAFPAGVSTINFDNAGVVTKTHSNGAATATGITTPVLKTGAGAQVQQGDLITVTTSGTFTGATGLLATVWLQEDNGASL